ncbi:hypothetical protein DUGA2_25140 [Duganella sp. HH101]|nr:hypothetical protein DUGA2_25140 [Duganella sp. HH101]
MALSAGKDKSVIATCVIAREIDAPDGVKPIEWRLLTNRETATPEAVVELIDWYRARWEVEMLFDVLKNACRVEALQLGSITQLERALALFRKKTPPAKPCLNDVLRQIACLGGFLARKSDGEPGVKTIWLGSKDVYVAAETIRTLREMGALKRCV